MSKIGLNEMNEVHLGTTDIESIYLGTQEVFAGNLKFLTDNLEGVPTAMCTYGDNMLYVATKIESSTKYEYFINIYEINLSRNEIFSSSLIYSHASISKGVITNNATDPADTVYSMRTVTISGISYLVFVSYDTSIFILPKKQKNCY